MTLLLLAAHKLGLGPFLELVKVILLARSLGSAGEVLRQAGYFSFHGFLSVRRGVSGQNLD